MADLISLAKSVGGPGSLRLLAVLAVIIVAWSFLWPRRPRSGGLLFAAICVIYLVMALPVVAGALASRLPPAPSPTDADIRDIQTLFIFDGDNRFGRMREFERIYALARPRQIFLLGRLSVYKDLLLMPIPREGLHHDQLSYNTSTQVERVATLMAGGGADHPAILVSRLQFPRVQAFVRQAGLPVLVVPAPLDEEPSQVGLKRWVPSLAALAVTRDALYELAALAYYR